MQKLLEVAQFKAIRGNLILVIIASYTLILELVNRSRSAPQKMAIVEYNAAASKSPDLKGDFKIFFFFISGGALS